MWEELGRGVKSLAMWDEAMWIYLKNKFTSILRALFLGKECPEGGDHQELRTWIPSFVCFCVVPWEKMDLVSLQTLCSVLSSHSDGCEGCRRQLNRVWNHLGDSTPRRDGLFSLSGRPGRDCGNWVHWSRKTYTELGWHHPVDVGPGLYKKEKAS